MDTLVRVFSLLHPDFFIVPKQSKEEYLSAQVLQYLGLV